MSHRLRLTLIIALWLAALAAPALIAVSLFSPLGAVELAHAGKRVAQWGTVLVLALTTTMALVWPPFFPSVRLWMRKTLRRAGTDPRPLREAITKLAHLETAQGHVDVARTAFNLGESRQALPHAVRAVELDPELISARYLLVRVLNDVDQRQEAIRQCRIVVRDEPDHGFGQAQQQLGMMLHKQGDLDDAIDVLEKHAKMHGPTRAAAFALGETYKARDGEGDASKAVDWFREAARAPIEGEHLPPEDALVRARARVRLWGAGSARSTS